MTQKLCMPFVLSEWSPKKLINLSHVTVGSDHLIPINAPTSDHMCDYLMQLDVRSGFIPKWS